MNLAGLLKKNLDPALLGLMDRVAEESSTLNFPVYLVGGSVRDLMLGRPINDLDLTLEGDAIPLGRALVKKYGGKLTAHEKFHTATWVFDSPISNLQSLDLISARRETYSQPGALPAVTLSAIDDDLRRRDFTINAMAIRLDGDHFGELHDPLHGQRDLENKIIRVLHDNSFVDDPTRIFRAVRYAGRYGFEIEPKTLALVNAESLAVLKTLSGERLRHELDLIFAEQEYPAMFARLSKLVVLATLDVPDFNESYSSLVDKLPEPGLGRLYSRVTAGYILWLMDSDPATIMSLSNRLSCTAELTNALVSASLLKLQMEDLKNHKPSEGTFAIEKYPLISVYEVYLVTSQKELMDFLTQWRHVKPVTTGDDLKARGLEPGPRFGEILRRLRAAWLDGEVKTETEERELLDKLVS